MAPLKQMNKQINLDRSIKTRSQQVIMKKDVLPKRKADESPLKRITVKRSAITEISQNLKENERAQYHIGKAAVKSTAILTTRETRSSSKTRKPLGTSNAAKPPIPPKLTVKEINKQPEASDSKIIVKDVKGQLSYNTKTCGVAVKKTALVSVLPKPTKVQVKTIKCVKVDPVLPKTAAKPRHSDVASDSSLYVSALEDLNLDDGVKDKSGKLTSKKKQRKPPPPGIEDFDKENINEPNSVAIYAMDIFEYLKSRESNFKISDYLNRQPDLNASMRALVVNWMVEVQENFELNHETLYLGVKLVDLYLSKVRVTKDRLQLVGCASLFVAAKYDERYPPIIDDMLYVCDGLYKSEDLTGMEVELLKAVDFQLGIPLSYRFLRRYARCNKLQMPTLTLARYILETSLLDYSTITYSDSKMASAALHLALIMKGRKEWTSTLEYYTGYKAHEFKDIMKVLNDVLHKKQTKDHAVKVKYSHKLFYEVAKIPLVSNANL